MIDGRIRQVGQPQAVFSAPADESVAAFVGVENVISGRVVPSPEGQVLVEAFGKRLEAVGDLPQGRGVLFCVRPEDVTLFPAGSAPASSARNRLSGSITRMLPQGPLMRVEVDCGFPLMATITRASAREMGMSEGLPVVATFKATAAHLIPK
jgi:molybdopterin-binding protein